VDAVPTLSSFIDTNLKRHNSFPPKSTTYFNHHKVSKWTAPNLSKSDFWHPFTCHKPLHLP